MVKMARVSLRRVKRKVLDARKKDRRKFGAAEFSLEDALSLLEDAPAQCPCCGCELLYDGWRPNCLYQFTFDLLDNYKAHTRSNCRILCYDCNCRFLAEADPDYRMGLPGKMTCLHDCHTGLPREEKALPRIVKLAAAVGFIVGVRSGAAHG